MKTKPFNLEEAKAGAKLVTRDGRPVRIICWDAKTKKQPIIALVCDAYGEEFVSKYKENGNFWNCCFGGNFNLDLLLVDETPELTEFEQAVLDNVFTVRSNTTVFASKNLAKKLLSIARKELQKEQKPAEWSEEDECTYKSVYAFFEQAIDRWYDVVFEGCYPKITREKVLSMLKSLRPQPHWKPSEEQMNALADAIKRDVFPNGNREYLESLYNDLKKLM